MASDRRCVVLQSASPQFANDARMERTESPITQVYGNSKLCSIHAELGFAKTIWKRWVGAKRVGVVMGMRPITYLSAEMPLVFV
jgi:hypothetical protein